ncbi:MAG: protein translocase subunit SecD [candidate division WOR-3 bacterium]|uniref:Protein translocase subunit SecD n=1 Tax=candidate division WOR-3 bacterium TaxID=2052148 RepID=A0A7C4S1T1_UNCW3
MKNIRWKIIFIAILFILALYSLYPTYRFYFVIPKELEKLNNQLKTAKTYAESTSIQNQLIELKKEQIRIHKKSIHLGLDLVGGMHLLLEVDKSKLSPAEANEAVDRALEVIRNRIDQFGVFEPIIQKTSEGRILIQLPGVDRERAKSLIGQTAQLEFSLVAEPNVAFDIFKKIDEHYKNLNPADTLIKFSDKIFEIEPSDFGCAEEDLPWVENVINSLDTTILGEWQILFGPLEPYQGKMIRRVYVIKKEPELTGAAVASAEIHPYSGPEAGLANTWVVGLKLKKQDAKKFASITGRNIGRRLAIILDKTVRSAPVIKERIPSGEAMITTGEINPDKAKEIAIVIKSGALPAPVIISEERSVGPTLGQDAINKGIKVIIFSAIIVFLFMIIYYNLSGLIADIALFLNIFFLLALLASLRATLTLPGIAGIALTIGMSVDANILIFERIREELRSGKTPLTAVDTGFKRATITIIDANITTIITGIVLYWLGTGPIRGFATTLIIGLLVNLFTAIFVARIFFELILNQFQFKRLPI